MGQDRKVSSHTFISDTARGILLAGLADVVGQTINLGSGRETRIRDLALTVARVVGRDTPEVQHEAERPGGVRRLIADASAARDLLGFEPEVPLEEGLARLRRWYEQRGVAPETLPEQEILYHWLPCEASR